MTKRLLPLLLILGLMACQSQQEDPSAKPDVSPTRTEHQQPPSDADEKQSEIASQTPPAPPLREDFQGTPQLSLFPRAGAFRPEDDDSEELGLWRTFIEHLLRTSGPIKQGQGEDADIAFSFQAIKGLDSLGFFSPLAVKPQTRYQLKVRLTCDLAEAAEVGVGLLEFDSFHWLGEQYPESLVKKTLTGTQKLVSLKGKKQDDQQQLSFVTGPKTGMIHLIFFREGPKDRNPVLIDDIEIKEVKNETQANL